MFRRLAQVHVYVRVEVSRDRGAAVNVAVVSIMLAYRIWHRFSVLCFFFYHSAGANGR